MNLRTFVSMMALIPLALNPLGASAQEADNGPAAVVGAFHQALASGDKQKALDLLDPSVLIFESGGAELSRDAYASHHLGADIKFAGATTNTVIDQRSGRDGQTAWVMTRSETSGTFRDKQIDSTGVETMVLQHSDGAWKIVHIHWSSRARKKSH